MAGRPVLSACERSALLSASISPAVPIDAVPDNGAITTETIGLIVEAHAFASAAVAGLARKLSDRTLTAWLIRVVSCQWSRTHAACSVTGPPGWQAPRAVLPHQREGGNTPVPGEG